MKKGFTLIELLAVIVILAIIALIAVPIVLNIINDSKESSLLRSAEFYLDAVEYAIADAFLYHGGLEDKTYPITADGDICKVALVDNECPMDGDKSNILVVEVNGDKPTGGYIKLTGGTISGAELELNEKTIVKNSKGELVYDEYVSPCILVSGDKNTIGSKYECEVKSGLKYNFYVLSVEDDGTTNLIMERNICEDGTVATSENKCFVAWYADAYDNSYGPVTAMDYLYKATKDWDNIPNIEVNYTDEGNTGFYGYGTITTSNNITKITKKDGTLVTVLTDQVGYSNLKVRMPYSREISFFDKTNLFLFDYLSQDNDIQLNSISGISGYWILSSYTPYYDEANCVNYGGNIGSNLIYEVNFYGVRPVINLKL